VRNNKREREREIKKEELGGKQRKENEREER
jgi:hypothetical protein